MLGSACVFPRNTLYGGYLKLLLLGLVRSAVVKAPVDSGRLRRFDVTILIQGLSVVPL